MTSVKPDLATPDNNVHGGQCECEEVEDTSNSEQHTQRTFWKALWPILIPMKVFGSWPYSIKGDFNAQNRCNIVVTTLLAVIAGFVVLLIVGYCGLMVWLEDYRTALSHIPTLLIISQVSFNLGQLVRCREQFKTCMSAWCRYASVKNNKVINRLRRNCYIFAVLLLGHNLYQEGLWALVHSAFMKSKLTPDVYYTWLPVLVVLNFILYSIFYVAGISTITLAVIFCMSLASEFTQIQKEMSLCKDLCGNIGKYRDIHQQLCRVLVATDEAFGSILGVCLTLATGATLLLMYVVTSESYYRCGTQDSILNIAILFDSIWFLLAVSFVCDKVHAKVSLWWIGFGALS